MSGALALLTAMSGRWMAMNSWDLFRQSAHRKVLFTVFSIVASGNKTANAVLLYKLVRFVFWPLDLLLFFVSWKIGGPEKTDGKSLVIVIGNHRSGTTVVAQLLDRAYKVAPVCNLLTLFPNATVVFRIFRPFLQRRIPSDSLKNYYGHSSGLFGLSDCYEVWDKWFGRDHSFPRTPSQDILSSDIPTYFHRLAAASGMPVLAKNNRATLSAGLLSAAMPNALFVYVERDAAEVVASVLEANKHFYGDESWVWGLRPHPAFPRRAVAGNTPKDAALRLAAEQQLGLEKVIQAELSKVPTDKLVRVRFEDMIGPNSDSAIAAMLDQISNRSPALQRRSATPPRLDSRPRARQRHPDIERLLANAAGNPAGKSP